MAAPGTDPELAEGKRSRIPVGNSPYVEAAPRYVRPPPATVYLHDKREARRRRLSDPDSTVYEGTLPIREERLPYEDGVYRENQVRFQFDDRDREKGGNGPDDRNAQQEDPLLDFRAVAEIYIDVKDVGSIYTKTGREEFVPTHDILSTEYFQELGKFLLKTDDLPKIKLSSDSELPRRYGRVHSLYEDVSQDTCLTKQDFLSDYGFALALRKWLGMNEAMLRAQIQLEFAVMADREYTSGPQWFRLRKLFKYWDQHSQTFLEREREEERNLGMLWYLRKLEVWGSSDNEAARPNRASDRDEYNRHGFGGRFDRRRRDRERRRRRRGSNSSIDSARDSGSGYSQEENPRETTWPGRIASWFSIRAIVDRRIERREDFSHGPALNEAKKERHYRHAVRKAELPQRIVAAVLGGALLITPMLIMSINQNKTKSLITSCISVYTFGLGLAFLSSVKIAELLGALAAYAAVLVVFVGVSGP